jgi:lambda repressor-like predicted transcriptional regulator
MATYSHHEDVKAAIRKRWGSMRAFEKAIGIPDLSARDILRGKSRYWIQIKMADALGIHPSELEVFRNQSHNQDSSKPRRPRHHLNRKAA